MYKAFLAYEPFKDTVKAIKGYVCTCRSGLKVIGSCVHIATLIFLLSNKKYVIKKPGEYLNSIFVDTNEMESPNKPRNVRSKRHNASSSSSSDSISSSY
jgi:hypothetical protein